MDAMNEVRVGISACLVGEPVRFDGGHKRDNFINTTLAEFVSFVPVCPEIDIGLGTPREALRLSREESGVSLVGVKSGTDLTRRMTTYSRRQARKLGTLNLSGYILKAASPSCGMERVRIYDQNGSPTKNGVGLFAQALMEKLPNLPVEEEGRLNDARLRENFFERIFAYRRLTTFFASRWSVGGLVRFHTAEKMLALSHDRAGYAILGKLVATAKGANRKELADAYQSTFMSTLKKIATTRKHTNVLQHMIGHLRKLLDTTDRQELVDLIEDYRLGLVPLIVPVSLIRHHVRRQDVSYLAGQTYLEPHPKELMLRNHV